MVPPPEPSAEPVASIETEEYASSEQQDQFETVSLESKEPAHSILRWAHPVFTVVVFCTLILSGVYSVRYGTDTITLADSNIDTLDGMYALALIFLGLLVAGRVYSSMDRTKRLLSRMRGRPLVLAGCVYVAVLFVAGSVAPFVVSEPNVQPTISLQPPAWSSVSDVVVPTCHGTVVDGDCQGTLSYPLGTNAGGQDLLTVGLLGLSTTLQVAVTASVIAATLGITTGVAAGYLGGRVDELLMRYVDIQRALPAFFVYILLILLFERSYPLMILVFGLLSWGGIARLVRSEVAQLRTTAYVRAARQSGAETSAIIRRHVLPALTGTVLTAIAVLFAKFVVYEASLAFLSLTDTTVLSLGNEIAGAVGRTGADPVGGDTGALHNWWLVPWIIYVPTGILCSLLLAVTLLGDSIQDIIDPRA